MIRKIIHIDMDAFFASIEQRDRPETRGKPVIIGGSPEHRGVVSTCSYEARAFGVHSAMPMRTAVKLCPNAVFLEVDLRRYIQVSEEIKAIFWSITDLVENVSIDEAYLDVTHNKCNLKSATRLAQEIQRRIFLKTQLTASAGVSYNKFLAKIASDMKKPAGLTVIRPDQALSFLDSLPIEKFHGIGRVTATKLHSINVKDGYSLRQLDLETLTSMFGKVGTFYYGIVRGIDERPVMQDDKRQSVGRETTLATDCTDQQRLNILIRSLAHKVSHALHNLDLAGRTVTLKVRYKGFITVTRSITLASPVQDGGYIGDIALELSHKTALGKLPVRLLGVTVSNLLVAPAPSFDAIQPEFPF